jgi:hypothetical protein
MLGKKIVEDLWIKLEVRTLLHYVIDQFLFSSVTFSFTITAVRLLGFSDLEKFFLVWLWTFGLAAVFSESIVTPARFYDNKTKLKDEATSVGSQRVTNLERISTFTYRLSFLFYFASFAPFAEFMKLALLGVGIVLVTSSMQAARYFERDFKESNRPGFRNLLFLVFGFIALGLLDVAKDSSALLILNLFNLSALLARGLFRLDKYETNTCQEVKSMKQITKRGWKFGLVSGVRVLLFSVALLAGVKLFKESFDVIKFGLVLTISGPMIVMSGVFNSFELPRFIKRYESSTNKLKTINRGLLFFLIPSLLFVIANSLLLNLLLGTVLGDDQTKELNKVWEILIGSSLLIFFTTLSNYVSMVFQILSEKNVLFINTTISGVLALACVIIFPSYLLSAIPYAFLVISSTLYFNRSRNTRF